MSKASDIILLLLDGQSIEEICAETQVEPRTVYDAKYRLLRRRWSTGKKTIRRLIAKSEFAKLAYALGMEQLVIEHDLDTFVERLYPRGPRSRKVKILSRLRKP